MRLWLSSEVTNTTDSLPSDLVSAHALILAERAARLSSEARASQAETDLTHAQATVSSADALIARLRLEIEKLRRTLYGARSERKERLLDQLEMQLEDAEADATEDELAAERASPSTTVKSFGAQAAGQEAVPGASAARAGGDRRAAELPVLRFGEAVEARRGRDRDARGRASPMEGDPDGARAFRLPEV